MSADEDPNHLQEEINNEQTNEEVAGEEAAVANVNEAEAEATATTAAPSATPSPAPASALRAPAAMSQHESDALAKARARGGGRMASSRLTPGATSVSPSTGGSNNNSHHRSNIPNVRTSQAEQDALAKSRAARPRTPRIGSVSSQQTNNESVSSIHTEGMRPGVEHVGPPVIQETVSAPTATAEGGLDELARRREERATARAERRGRTSVASAQTTQSEPTPTTTTTTARMSTATASSMTSNVSRTNARPFANMSEDERQRRYDAKMAEMGQGPAPTQEQQEPPPVPAPAPPPRQSVRTPAPFANMSEDERQRRYDAKMAQMGQSEAQVQSRDEPDEPPTQQRAPVGEVTDQQYVTEPTSRPSNVSTVPDEERQRQFDAKMAQMNQGHKDNLEKRGDDGPKPDYEQKIFEASQKNMEVSMKNMDASHNKDMHYEEQPVEESFGDEQYHEPTSSQPHGQALNRSYVDTTKADEFRDETEDYHQPPPVVPLERPQTTTVTTADYGIAVAPDVEYGEFTQPIVPDNQLAVAIEIDDEEEEEEEKFFAHAVEYDPDSKPPIYRNRRFRLYGIGGLILFIIITVVMVVGIVSLSGGSSPTVVESPAPTVAPTQSPTTLRQAIYRNYFAEEVSPLVYVPGTPHYLAAEWIMNEDPLQIQPDNNRLLQRYMMAFFYFHTTNNGENKWRSCNPPEVGEDDVCVFSQFTRLDNDEIDYVNQTGKVRWLSGQEECDWQGVLCAGGAQILGIDLFGQLLTGTLPTELVALPFLQKVSIAYNELTGTIPSEYAQFRHLLALEVHGNMLTGTIPEAFYEQDSSSLITFNVGDNMLSGTVDTRIGQMTDLKGLHIFENNFDGTFPTEVGRLPYLAFTRFNGNQFEGEIPTGFGRLAQLTEFWGHQAGFTGTIPTQLGSLRRLKDLRIWGNQLTGTLPDELWDLTKLTRLSVRENQLTGTLSKKVRRLKDLTFLRVSDNQFTGQIPPELHELVSLKVVWLQLNLFEGPISDEICENVLSDGSGILVLQADCFPSGDDDEPPVPCRCCTSCCNREDRICLFSDSG